MSTMRSNSRLAHFSLCGGLGSQRYYAFIYSQRLASHKDPLVFAPRLHIPPACYRTINSLSNNTPVARTMHPATVPAQVYKLLNPTFSLLLPTHTATSSIIHQQSQENSIPRNATIKQPLHLASPTLVSPTQFIPRP